jgi:hypothetical protein
MPFCCDIWVVAAKHLSVPHAAEARKPAGAHNPGTGRYRRLGARILAAPYVQRLQEHITHTAQIIDLMIDGSGLGADKCYRLSGVGNSHDVYGGKWVTSKFTDPDQSAVRQDTLPVEQAGAQRSLSHRRLGRAAAGDGA